jgi:hypothetical protein
MTLVKIKEIISIAIISICLSCNNNGVTKVETTNKIDRNDGSVNNPITIYSNHTGFLNFYYIDSFYYGHQIIIKNGVNEIGIKSPLLLLQADNNQTPFLLNPGEKIKLILDSSGVVYLTMDDNRIRGNELRFYKQLIKNTSIMREGFDFLAFQKSVKNLSEIIKSENIIDENKK